MREVEVNRHQCFPSCMRHNQPGVPFPNPERA